VNAPTPVITIGTQPAASTTVTQGNITGSLSVTASVSPSATLSYQWYQNSANSTSGGTSLGTTGGAQTNTLTIPTNLTAGGNYYYYCIVSATGGAESQRSKVATVIVEPSPVPIITITAHPATSTTFTVGSILGSSLTVTANVTLGETLSYQWYSNTSNSNVGGTLIIGAEDYEFTIPSTLSVDTYYYFCEVSATGGATSKRSNVATIIVNAIPPVPVITITTDPTPSSTFTQGSILGSLSVTASVTPAATLSYRWHSNTSNSNVVGTPIGGAAGAGATYTIPTTLTANTYYYFCEVSATGATSVRSDVAKVVVNPIVTDGVLIEGIIWATSNVDAFRTFAAKPEDFGMFYQWNRAAAWPTTGEAIGFDENEDTGIVWEETKDPCPAGWRVPTWEELEKLIDQPTDFTPLNGVNGVWIGTAPNRIFLPATGFRSQFHAFGIEYIGEIAHYPSNKQSLEDARCVPSLSIYLPASISMDDPWKFFGNPVRCVKK
jgi:uncharacterized protein (TIGR02145 family)